MQISPDIPLKSLLKRFALLYLPVVIILSGILLLGARFNRQSLVENTKIRESSRVEVAKGRVTQDLLAIDTDLRVISNLPLLQNYLDSDSQALKAKLEKYFMVVAQETRRYDQIRYLDASGHEVIRINYQNGKPVIIPRQLLQNKANRYYFSDTFKLKQGEIYVSPLDLNIEHGKIEIPYKPMIRYGTPVFNSAGQKKGIILLNYLGGELLQDFRSVMQSGMPHRSMLLNQDGYWLSSDKREDAWGFMLGKKERIFGHDFPEAWNSISTGDHGSLLTDQGLFTYTTVFPLLAGRYSSMDSTLMNARNQQGMIAHGYNWKIVSFVPRNVLSGAAFYNRPYFEKLVVAVYLLLALATFLVAGIALSRERAKQEIIKLNKELEKRVAEHAAGEENLSVTLKSIGDGVMTTDAEGRVTRLNTIAEQLTGWLQTEAIGRPVSDVFNIINQKTHQPAIIPVAETLKKGVIHGLANGTLLIARDGSKCPIADSCAPIHDRKGVVIGTVLVFRDVTSEYEAEKLLLQAKEKAEQANQAKDSFLATMSHEIRTPLTGMMGMLELLSMTSLDDEQNKTLKAAWDSTRSLLRIVNDILDWSKIQEGKLEISPQSTSIPQLVQEVVNTYSRVASTKNLMLWQHADSRLSAAHIVDPLRLSQILNNFVSNALKFTEYGEIELRAELLEQFESSEKIRFSVKDTGPGIPEDVQKNLFQRYHQESADTARQYGGTGLGLAICLRLAELLDGKIDLTSAPGQGSTFSITVVLPISAAQGEQIPALTPTVEQRKIGPLFDSSAQAPLVLAVDDHPINRDMLASQIKLLGLRPETAENGQVALSKLQHKRFVLIITDCHMPKMDGYELARSVREIEAEKKLRRTPMIAWTANTGAGESELCRTAGFDDLLVKPASLSQLKTMLKKWLPNTELDNSQSTPAILDTHSKQITGPIDFVVLSEVVPDSAEHIRVLKEFQSHLRDNLTELLEHLEQNDRINVKHAAHRMKGSCRMVGAMDIASSCASIEQNSREGNMDSVHTEMVRLNDAIKQFETYLAEMVA